MSYIVKTGFADLQDNRYFYHEGDTFPRDGNTVSDERIAQLSGRDNLMGRPLIAWVGDPPVEIVEMPKESEKPEEAEPEEKPTTSRKRGRKNA